DEIRCRGPIANLFGSWKDFNDMTVDLGLLNGPLISPTFADRPGFIFRGFAIEGQAFEQERVIEFVAFRQIKRGLRSGRPELHVQYMTRALDQPNFEME